MLPTDVIKYATDLSKYASASIMIKNINAFSWLVLLL